MGALSQVWAVTAMNLKNVPKRAGTSLVIVIGIAGVVAVLISVLSMSAGLIQTFNGNGREDRAVVLYKGAVAAALSTLSREAVAKIIDGPGIKKTVEGQPAASPATVVLLELPSVSGVNSNAQLRGVGGAYFQVRPEIRVTEGRLFHPGVRELIVGAMAQSQFKGLEVGGTISFRDNDWTVVGKFEAAGDAVESELIGDADTVMSAYRRPVFQEVRVLLESPEALAQLQSALAGDPTLSVDIKRETDFNAAQSRSLTTITNIIAYVVGGIMAVGALFGALNTMYSAVSTRAHEIATLRAIGFGGGAVVISVLVEALILAIIGALLGAAFAWVFFNGNTFSSTFGGVTQVAALFLVTPGLVVTGIIWAIALGLAGGLFPAIRAARLPVAAALKVR